jgi:hypothetical protein
MTRSSVRRAWVVSLSLAACTDRGDVEEKLGGIDDREGQVCVEADAERTCGRGGAGAQFCGALVDGSNDLHWGPCLAESEIECMPGHGEVCEDGGGDQTCILEDGEPTWGECVYAEGGVTPLVLVPHGVELEFEPAGTATFAIAGECITQDWPSAATPWLAIDLDRSGSIDDGRELFGSGTMLRDGTHAKDGFAALARLDDDGDGVITKADARFAELVLWSDHDGDRRSTHWEHVSLASAGITAIPLAYDRDRRCDARGNCAIERASVEAPEGSAAIVDVHLACQ